MSNEYLEQDRKSYTKPFSQENQLLRGKSVSMEYEKYPDYVESNTLHKACITYATAYTETMLTRAQVEDPEVFAMRGMSKQEMQAHLVNNMCIQYSKLNARVFRDTTAKIDDKNYLNDDIRRLYNGGDKFHPYF